MANAVKIKIDFQKAINQANELERIANSIKSVSQDDLEDCLNEISFNWTGENSKNYLKKGKKVKQDIDDIADDLMRIVEVMREIIENDMEAEREAQRIIMN